MPEDTMTATRLGKNQTPALLNAMTKALVPTNIELKRQSALLVQISKSNKVSAENAMEGKRAAKKAAKNEDKQTSLLQRLLKSKGFGKAKGGLGSFLGDHWGKLLLGGGLAALLFGGGLPDNIKDTKLGKGLADLGALIGLGAIGWLAGPGAMLIAGLMYKYLSDGDPSSITQYSRRIVNKTGQTKSGNKVDEEWKKGKKDRQQRQRERQERREQHRKNTEQARKDREARRQRMNQAREEARNRNAEKLRKEEQRKAEKQRQNQRKINDAMEKNRKENEAKRKAARGREKVANRQNRFQTNRQGQHVSFGKNKVIPFQKAPLVGTKGGAFRTYAGTAPLPKTPPPMPTKSDGIKGAFRRIADAMRKGGAVGRVFSGQGSAIGMTLAGVGQAALETWMNTEDGRIYMEEWGITRDEMHAHLKEEAVKGYRANSPTHNEVKRKEEEYRKTLEKQEGTEAYRLKQLQKQKQGPTFVEKLQNMWKWGKNKWHKITDAGDTRSLDDVDLRLLSGGIAEQESRGKRTAQDPQGYLAENSLGYLGKYQMGIGVLEDLGIMKRGSYAAMKKEGHKKIINNPKYWNEGYSKTKFLEDGGLQEKLQMKMLDIKRKELKRIVDEEKPGGKGWNDLHVETKKYLVGMSHISGAEGAAQVHFGFGRKGGGKRTADAYGTQYDKYGKAVVSSGYSNPMTNINMTGNARAVILNNNGGGAVQELFKQNAANRQNGQSPNINIINKGGAGQSAVTPMVPQGAQNPSAENLDKHLNKNQ